MFPFKQVLSTKNITPGMNTKQFIILHHTGTFDWTIKGVLNQLTVWPVSCHFVVDTNGDAYKIWSPDDILWHAWESSWGTLQDMNKYSLGIEVIWPLANGWFTDAERNTVRALVQHLMAVFGIPKENVIRHKDIAPKRKIDPMDSLWSGQYKTYKDFQNSLIPKQV